MKKMPPPRSWYIALLLAFFLGWFGADRFYICRYKGAWMKALTLGGLGIWWLSEKERGLFEQFKAMRPN